MQRRTLIVSMGLAIPALVLVGAAAYEYWPREAPPPLAAPRQPALPDLTMPPLTDVLAGRQETGAVVLFFTAAIGNVGDGPFLIHAVRGDERAAWRVDQRFREADGSLSGLTTPTGMEWGGHGHDHWHVKLGASYRLVRVGGDASNERRYKKQGYCFFDQQPLDLSLPGASRVSRFPKTGCDGLSRLSLDMGLSSGWNDPYQWTLPDQALPIVGLRDGIYRLTAVADPDGWFRESNEKNNTTWVELRLTTSVDPPRVKVLRSASAG